MALDVRQTSIYFNTQFARLSAEQIPRTISAPVRVGDIWARIRETFQSPAQNSESERESLLARLGVAPTDRAAHKELMPMLETVCSNADIQITPSAKGDDSGVYFLSNEGNPFAVFKAGEPRAEIEPMVRELAHLTGFEENAIPGVICSIANPVFPEVETVVELWNGNQKVYTCDGEDYNDLVQKTHAGLERVPTLTGILEPFLPSTRKTTPEEFAAMTTFALIAGLRDGKEDGYVEGRLIDSAECMPGRLVPDRSPQKFTAATYLPFLIDPLATQTIGRELVSQLSTRINKLQPDEILSALAKKRIEFADLISEEQNVNEQIFDHGGCFVVIEKTPQFIEGQHKHLDTQNPESFRLLSDEQLAACKIRMTRLQTCLNSAVQDGRPLTCLGVVRDVDPLYDAHMRALEREKSQRQPLPHVVGRLPLAQTNVELSPATTQALRKSCSEERSFRGRIPGRGTFLSPPEPSDHPRSYRR